MSTIRAAQTPRTRLRIGFGAVFAVLSLLLAPAPAASAHAALIDSDPVEGSVLERAPDEVVLVFNEAVQPIGGGFQLVSSSAGTIPLQAHGRGRTVVVELPETIAAGTQLLGWRVVSADGHPISGTLIFHLGAPSMEQAPAGRGVEGEEPAVQAAYSFLTGTHYLGLLLFAGLLVIERLVLRRRRIPRGANRAVLRWALGTAALSAVLLVPLGALRLSGAALSALLRPEHWIEAVFWQPAVIAVLTLGCGVVAYLAAVSGALGGSARPLIALLTAAVALASPVLLGHTMSKQPTALVMAADVVHLLAGAVWLGGLAALLLAIPRSGRWQRGGSSDGDAADSIQAVGIVQRFSTLAALSALLLGLSGTTMALVILPSPEALITTGYGRALLTKLGLVLVVVSLAQWNRVRLLPLIQKTPEAGLGWRRLRQVVGYEAGILLSVLLVTGVLTNLNPEHSHHASGGIGAGTPIAETRSVLEADLDGGIRLHGELSPMAPGSNRLVFVLMDADGGTVSTLSEPVIRAFLPAGEFGPIAATARLNSETGEYEASITLPVAGQWRIEIAVRLSRYEEPIAVFLIEMP